jgi:tetratricopeptide (TPR) repeat protein
MTMRRTLQFKVAATWTPLLAWFFIAIVGSAPAFAEPEGWICGTLRSQGQYGPYDYRTARGESLRLVEGAHFLPDVEALIRGKTSTTAGGDIDYTLRAFPNHHRALIAMTRLSEKEQKAKPVGSHYSIDCWYERAVLFQPDDLTVRMLYAIYLNKNNRQSDAVAQLGYATSFAKDNGFTHYNIGLVYFDMKVYDEALASAHRALALGFSRTGLRDQLNSVGQWKEPLTTAAPAN